MSNMSPALSSILLLIAANVFMTFAWYGHLRYKSTPLMLAVLASWGIAFFEYCLQVPGNRIGSAALSTAQLKMRRRSSRSWCLQCSRWHIWESRSDGTTWLPQHACSQRPHSCS